MNTFWLVFCFIACWGCIGGAVVSAHKRDTGWTWLFVVCAAGHLFWVAYFFSRCVG